jgi:hypothetical protein
MLSGMTKHNHKKLLNCCNILEFIITVESVVSPFKPLMLFTNWGRKSSYYSYFVHFQSYRQTVQFSSPVPRLKVTTHFNSTLYNNAGLKFNTLQWTDVTTMLPRSTLPITNAARKWLPPYNGVSFIQFLRSSPNTVSRMYGFSDCIKFLLTFILCGVVIQILARGLRKTWV